MSADHKTKCIFLTQKYENFLFQKYFLKSYVLCEATKVDIIQFTSHTLIHMWRKYYRNRTQSIIR